MFNRAVKEETGDNAHRMIGLRPGEAFNCIHSHAMEAGCGTSEKCSTCGAVNAILDSIKTGWSSQDCHLTVQASGGKVSYDFRVSTSALDINGQLFIIFALQDIASDMRRAVLERIFFHDILNTAGVIKGYTDLFNVLDGDEVGEAIGNMSTAADRLIGEIRAQRDLLSAETGELKVDISPIEMESYLSGIASLWRKHKVAERKELKLEIEVNPVICTDGIILGRVLGNLLKNGFEAETENAVLTLRCSADPDGSTVISVNNPSVMPREVQLQVFERSFSTKGAGRGVGTYSIQLLTTRYLKGDVWFESNEADGTTFFVKIR
jgi:signal transduction histidine kinase